MELVLQGASFAFSVAVEPLQRLVHAFADEGLNSFRLGANVFDVAETCTSVGTARRFRCGNWNTLRVDLFRQFTIEGGQASGGMGRECQSNFLILNEDVRWRSIFSILLPPFYNHFFLIRR